nr:DDE-type integrase/transposase/recombinase [Yersinia ruckeri]
MAPNLLNYKFNPPGSNQVWVSDITDLQTGESWLYVVAFMDLYSRRIVGWHIDKRMTADLICKGLFVHTEWGSQYTSTRFQILLADVGLRSCMGDVGAYWDNAVMERFLGSLKYKWVLRVKQPARTHMG